jgi:hypothetical protein
MCPLWLTWLCGKAFCTFAAQAPEVEPEKLKNKSMHYELTVTMRFDSDRSEGRIVKLFESLFEFGTMKESIAEGLQLLDDPRLLTIAVARTPGSEPTNSASAS